MEDEGYGTDSRLAAVSVGFPIILRPDTYLNARAAFSSHSTESIVDLRFARASGLLYSLLTLRPCDEVEMREVGSNKLYRVYGLLAVPFDAGKWSFKQDCWVVDMAGPVEILLGNDWLNQYRARVSFSLSGMTLEDAKAPLALQPVVDSYRTTFARQDRNRIGKYFYAKIYQALTHLCMCIQ
ncbi:hypothetical protein FA95DRAFT_861479 [Auriscalpium vulgare]|uniref:Uncharacterized protein n=1 Tax=Auriscalpium vulgare TaxID=40419 RepID=A0ACB8RZ85_9AGAM|nr:hypothetical protein FA95DRAFT_861479 [Auriscalpium vulgare]